MNVFNSQVPITLKEFLMPIYEARAQSRKHYSLRAFAKDLGVSSGRLSTLLNSDNIPSEKVIQRLKTCLQLNDEQFALLRDLVERLKNARKQECADRILNEYNIDLILDWVPFAILSLMEIPDFEMSIESIAQRFCVEEKRIVSAIERLSALGMISQKEGKWVPTGSRVATTTDIPSSIIRTSHAKKLDLAKDKIEEVESNLRDFSSITFPCNPSKMTSAKKLIIEFRRKLAEMMQEEGPTEVYNLSIQLFPLSKVRKKL